MTAQASVHRSIGLNTLAALGFVVVPAIFVVSIWYGDGSDGVGSRITWWSVGLIAFAAAIGAVRALRQGVVVKDTALVQRTLFFTRIVPWSRVGFRHPPMPRISTLTCVMGGSTFHISVSGREKSKSFRGSVERARAAALSRRNADDSAWPPSGRYRWAVIALWGSLAAMLLGAVVSDLALWDRDRYNARAARDRRTVATVTSSRILEHEDSEGDVSYSTRVGIVFTANDHRVVSTLDRSHRYHYRRRQQLPVVYDAAHPKDADFADRPNRGAQESSASLRLWTGAVTATLGIVAGVVFGIFVCLTRLCRWKSARAAVV
jgi:hypothetical protein